jgi:hypothetical protein
MRARVKRPPQKGTAEYAEINEIYEQAIANAKSGISCSGLIEKLMVFGEMEIDISSYLQGIGNEINKYHANSCHC